MKVKQQTSLKMPRIIALQHTAHSAARVFKRDLPPFPLIPAAIGRVLVRVEMKSFYSESSAKTARFNGFYFIFPLGKLT